MHVCVCLMLNDCLVSRTGGSIVALWAFAAALVPSMQKGNNLARNAHIAANTINVGLFLWQVSRASTVCTEFSPLSLALLEREYTPGTHFKKHLVKKELFLILQLRGRCRFYRPPLLWLNRLPFLAGFPSPGPLSFRRSPPASRSWTRSSSSPSGLKLAGGLRQGLRICKRWVALSSEKKI